MKYTVKELQKTVDIYEIEVTVDYAELAPIEEQVYQELSKDVKIQGFRPGKAPRAQIESRIGSKMLTESIGRLLPLVAWEVIKEKDYRPTGAPEYSLKKMSDGDGIVFTMSFVNYPSVKLGDFSKIKIKKQEPTVTAEDIDSVIRSIVRSSLKPEEIAKLAPSTETKKTTKKEEGKESKEEAKPAEDKFPITDELVKALKYEDEDTADKLRKSVEEKLKNMKLQQSENEYTTQVLEKAVEISTFDIPKSFLEREVKAAEGQFTERLKELKLDVDTYLKTQGTDIEKKRNDWTEDAKKKIGIDLVLIALANEHDNVANDEDIDKEIESIQDPQVRAQYESDNAREYIRTVLTRQRGMVKLMDIVEGKKEEKKAA